MLSSVSLSVPIRSIFSWLTVNLGPFYIHCPAVGFLLSMTRSRTHYMSKFLLDPGMEMWVLLSLLSP